MSNAEDKVLSTARFATPSHSSQLLLIGVEHHFHQYLGDIGGKGAPEQFVVFLREKCDAYKPDLLAEELSEEIVDQTADDSVLRVLAGNLGLPHLFCDPDDAERRVLNYPDESRVGEYKFGGDKERTAVYMKQFWPIREGEWLRRIVATDARKCLLVIGAAHVETLSIRAVEFDFSPVVLCDRWRPGL